MHGVDRLVEGDDVVLAIVVADAQVAQPAGPLGEHHEILEARQAQEVVRVAAGDDLGPGVLARPILAGPHQPVVLVGVVGQDEDIPTGVIEAVAVILAPGCHHELLALGIARIQQAQFVGDVGAGGDDEVAPAAGLADRDEEGGVALLVEHGIAAGVGAQTVSANPIRAQLVVELDPQERALALDPGDRAGGVGDEIGEELAAAEVLHVDAKALRAVLVGRPGEERCVRADLQRPQPEIALGRRFDVLVQDDFGLGRSVAAAQPGTVLRTGRKAPMVLEGAIAHRHGGIVLLDPRLELGMQLLDQPAVGCEEGIDVGVLLLEIGADVGVGDLGVVRVTQPGVIVVPQDAEALAAAGPTLGYGRFRL